MRQNYLKMFLIFLIFFLKKKRYSDLLEVTLIDILFS